MKDATNQKVTVVGRIALHVKMGDCRVKVVFGDVRHLVVPVLVGTSFMDRLVKGIFSLERKMVSFSSEPVPILAIKNLPEEPKKKDMARGVLIKKR